MPWGLKRYRQVRCLHFITFSCYRRAALLRSAQARHVFEATLEEVRQWYGFCIVGYVVMPEHVHLLVSEPERKTLSIAIQMLKQNVARRLRKRAGDRFWQVRYYDFPVWSEKKRAEKLRYIHRNPVTRGLVQRPENWRWSSFCHYLTGIQRTVEIESPWADRKREGMGVRPLLRRVESEHPRPVVPKTGATRAGQPRE